MNHVFHVIRHVRLIRNQRIQLLVQPVNRIAAPLPRRIIHIVRRNKTQQLPHHRETFRIVTAHEVRNSRSLVMRVRPAQLILRHLFVRHRLDHIRPRNKHVRSLINHQNKIGNRRRINRSTRAGPHNRRDLRHHSAVQRVAQENVCIARQRHHAFLNARSARIIQPNHGSPHLRRQIHDLHDLRGIRLRK